MPVVAAKVSGLCATASCRPAAEGTTDKTLEAHPSSMPDHFLHFTNERQVIWRLHTSPTNGLPQLYSRFQINLHYQDVFASG